MGLTKSDIFTEEQNNLADLAKVLGHPARIAILQHLIKVNACIGGDLVNEIGLLSISKNSNEWELYKELSKEQVFVIVFILKIGEKYKVFLLLFLLILLQKLILVVNST